jgi:hypothetical protein
MPRQPRLDAPGALHHVMGRGIDRAKIFRKQEEEGFQGTTVVLSAGGEEDGLSRSGSGPFPWRDHFGRRSRCTFRGSA